MSSPHVAQETFYDSQNDKHSDFEPFTSSVTVMAVAADFHCDFLIPEVRRQAAHPIEFSLEVRTPNCVYSFFDIIISFAPSVVKSLRRSLEISEKSSIGRKLYKKLFSALLNEQTADHGRLDITAIVERFS